MGNEIIVHGPVLQEKNMTICKIETDCKMIVCKIITVCKMTVCKVKYRCSLQEHGMRFLDLNDMRMNTICKSRKYILVKLHKKRKRV